MPVNAPNWVQLAHIAAGTNLFGSRQHDKSEDHMVARLLAGIPLMTASNYLIMGTEPTDLLQHKLP